MNGIVRNVNSEMLFKSNPQIQLLTENCNHLYPRGGRLCEVLSSLARAPWPKPHPGVPGSSVSRPEAVAPDHPEPLFGSAVSLRQDPSPTVSARRDSVSQVSSEAADCTQPGRGGSAD